MRQQVNLYRSEFSRDLPFPNAVQGFQVLLVVATILVFVILWQWFQLSQSAGVLVGIADETARATDALEELQAKLPADRMKPVEQEIVELNAELSRLREIRVLMAGQGAGEQLPGNKHGFSNQMEGLSRQHIKGIAVSRVGLLQGGKLIEMQGFTAPPQQAPRFLAALQKDEAFKTASFGQLDITRLPESGEVAFTVMDKREEEEE